MSRFKAVIFDIDGTLTDETSWTALTRDLGGSPEAHQAIFADFSNRKTGYGEAKKQLLELWAKTGNAKRVHIEKVFASWPLKQEAAEVVKSVKEAGLGVCLISGSLNLYAEHIAERLGVEDWYANAELHFDPDGALNDFDYDPDQSGKKREQLKKFCAKYEFEPGECAAVGDSNNDVELFSLTGHGILIEGEGATEELRHAAWKTVSSLSEVPDLLK